jgi:hypothetical protein
MLVQQLGAVGGIALSAVLAIAATLSTPVAALAASQSVADSSAVTIAPVASTALPEIRYPVHMDVSPPLISLDAEQDQTGNLSFKGTDRGQKQLPIDRLAGGHGPAVGSPTVSPGAPAVSAPTVGVNFDGVGVGLGSYAPCCAPPDPNGAIGLNDYVQTTNLDFAVFTKTGALRYGPAKLNTLWSGFGGGCQANNDGDPIVLYDQLADRWLISQFSVTTLPYLQCVAVSTTSDPTGTYFRSSYSYGNVDFPDYPKIGIWPDAYYATYNIFANGSTFTGAETCAWDRTKMLSGAVATQQCYKTSNLFGGLLPSSLDGKTLPPTGAPNYVLALDTSTTLVSWKFHVDWTTPASSTFTGPTSLSVPSYAASCATASRGACVPQGGSGAAKLESLADRLMYRLAYRNFGDHQALVVNHSIDVGSGTTLHAGVRWYEIRPDANNNLSLFQTGTYAPDNSWRWMGSIAMDKSGNMGLGYSVSSSTISPQIHFTGRLAADAAGTMTQGENVVINGGGSQNGGLARWGDYSSMAIDPVDDCTFWYTNEYLKATGSFNWSTRINAFKLPNCGVAPTPDFSLSASPASQTVTQGTNTSYTVTVTPGGGFAGSVTLSVIGLPSGAAGTFSPNPTATTSTFSVTTAASTPAGSYPLTITGTSGTLTHTASVTLVVNPAPTPDFTLSATPSSQTVVQGSGTTYTATVTPTNGFTGPVDLSVSGLPAGAAGTFSPTAITTSGNSTLSVTTSTTTPTGTYSLTITGTSGSLTHSATVTLVVNAPADYSLAATPASQTVAQGAGTSYTVAITRTAGFTGAVSFIVSGLPTGAAGTFSPNNTTGNTSTLSVTTTATTTPTGSYPLTITGTSGALTHTATVTLVVNPAPAGNFTLSATPASRTINRGTSTTYTVTITRTSFTGAVAFSVAGLPAGATATFNPNNTIGTSSTLTVTTTATTATGTFSLTISGVSGGLTHTANVTLIVNVPCTNGNCQN